MLKTTAMPIQSGSASSQFVERVTEPDQLREEEVDPDQEDEHDDARLQQAFGGEDRQAGGPALPGLLLGPRVVCL